MNFAIIAAGEGSRLAQEGVAVPKPLVEIEGEPMMGRLIHIFERAGAEKIVVCINEFMPEVAEYLEGFKAAPGVELVVKRKTTPSSMHTFKVVSDELRGQGRFIATTVDTIFKEEDFRPYVDMWENAPDEIGAMMAMTSYIDDEKPLYIDVEGEGKASGDGKGNKNGNGEKITAFRDAPGADTKYVSGGIYGLDDRACMVLEECLASGKSRMRNFQRALVEDGLDVRGVAIGKIMDVDHAGDIAKARDFLESNKK